MEARERVAELRVQGLTPKQIARTLGMRPAEVAEIVRAHAAAQAATTPAPRVLESLISPGWSAGLGLDGNANAWRDLDRQSSDAQGLVSVLIAREHRQANVSVCGYLVDVFCLGLKDALGPRAMTAAEYPEFASRYFQSFADAPIRVPIELAQALVIGAVEYARALGFEPHRDFERARPHLGDWNSPSPIVFGDRGRPHYISGPHDDPMRVIATLRRTVGDGKFITTILG